MEEVQGIWTFVDGYGPLLVGEVQGYGLLLIEETNIFHSSEHLYPPSRTL